MIEYLLNKEIKHKLENIWNIIKDHCKCIILTGSYIIPYIKNKHDIDIVYIYDNASNAMWIRRQFRENEELKNIKNFLKDKYNIAIFGSSWESELVYRPILYLCRNAVVLFGEWDKEAVKAIDAINNQDLFKNKTRDLYKRFFDDYIEKGIVDKNIYHVLTCKYFCDNNSYELTEEQIKNLNIVHDELEEDYNIREKLLLEAREWLWS